MSREGAKAKQGKAPTGGTPIWVWLVYGLGILAATVLVGSGLFAVGALIAADDSFGLDWNVSILAFLLWGGLIVLAAVTWLWRRGGGR
jgi:membrane protein implicated in regulation of membrane protease activity